MRNSPPPDRPFRRCLVCDPRRGAAAQTQDIWTRSQRAPTTRGTTLAGWPLASSSRWSVSVMPSRLLALATAASSGRWAGRHLQQMPADVRHQLQLPAKSGNVRGKRLDGRDLATT
jgi:hypothetical protein